MEKLVHTADGKLEPDDPFLRVGTKAIYNKGSTHQQNVVIDEESIKRTKDIQRSLQTKSTVFALFLATEGTNNLVGYYSADKQFFTVVD